MKWLEGLEPQPPTVRRQSRVKDNQSVPMFDIDVNGSRHFISLYYLSWSAQKPSQMLPWYNRMNAWFLSLSYKSPLCINVISTGKAESNFMQCTHLFLLRAFRGRPCSGPFSLHFTASRARAAGCRRTGQRIDWDTGAHCASSRGVIEKRRSK